MIKRIAHLIMLFNIILLGLIVLPSCKDFGFTPRSAYVVSMKVEKINGLDVPVFSCEMQRTGTREALQLCDTKQECNAYCDKMRANYERREEP